MLGYVSWKMIFFKKKKDASITELGNLLNYIEGGENKELVSTVVQTYAFLRQQQKKYFTEEREPKRGKHGALYAIDYSPDSDLKINGGDATYYPESQQYNIRNKKGQALLEQIIYKNQDGAVELSRKGDVLSSRRWLSVDYEQDAVDWGLADSKENVPSRVWGYGEKVGKKHNSIMPSSIRDLNAYFISMSEDTGDIRVIKAGEILLSTGIPHEVPARYAIFLNSLYHQSKQALARKTSDYKPEPVLAPPPKFSDKVPMYL